MPYVLSTMARFTGVYRWGFQTRVLWGNIERGPNLQRTESLVQLQFALLLLFLHGS
jgi:hypothetical protein